MIRARLAKWAMAAWWLAVLTGSAADVTIFSDDFSTPALLAEKWKLTPPAAWAVADGVLASAAEAGSRGASANVQHDGPVAVRLRVKSPKLIPGQWCGVNVRGILFTLRNDSFWYVYRIDGAERSLGNMKSSAAPQPDTWYEFEIVQREQLWQWRVNGETIAEFRESNTIAGGGQVLALASSGSPLVCDNVQVLALSSNPNASPNLVQNASFEQPPPDHIPRGWIPWHTDNLPPERLWRDWQVVEGDAYHGTHAMRLTGHPGSVCDLFTNGIGVSVGQPCTFSIYLKAGLPGTKVDLIIWEWWSKRHVKQVVVGTEWERFTTTLLSPAKNMVRCGIVFSAGTWVLADAAQLELTEPVAVELGDPATEWRLSDLDQIETADPYAELPIPEPRTLVRAEQAPVLDGKLDEALWNDAARLWPLRLPKNQAPREATDAYAVFHGDTLYIGMRCHDSQAASIKAAPAERDHGSIFGQDNIEIFLDPELDRADYFQLTVTASGAQFDAGPGRNRGWNGAWEAKAFVGDTFWSMEAALPLTMLNLSPLTGRAWGINLCRSQSRLAEITSTAHAISPNFHIPERYPELIWPEQVDLARYLLLPADLAVIEDSPGVARLIGRLLNRTGSDLTLDLAGAFDDNTPWQLAGVAVAAGADVPFSLALPKTPAAKGGESYLSATIHAAGNPPRLLRSLHQSIPVQPVLDCLLERSVYATELEATLIATLRLPPEQLAGATLKLEPGGEFADLTPHLTRTFSIAGLPVGEHALTVTLVGADGQPRASGSVTLRKLAPSQPAVALDRARRCLVVNGQPFLAIGPLYGLHAHQKPEHVDLLLNQAADSGFRTVMIVAKIEGDAFMKLWDRVFEVAQKRNLMIVAWPGGFNKLANEEFGPYIDRYKAHPSLLAWMPVDEPELYTTAEPTIATLSYFAARDPYHPSYMNNSIMAVPSRFAGLPGDILSIDDYLTNRPNRQVIEMVRGVWSINEVAVPTRRPTWLFLTGNNLMNHSREATAGEQVAETYGTVIAGASGLFYFMGNIASPAHWAAVKQTNAELMSLTPAILSVEPAPAVTSSTPAVHVAARRVGSQLYLICVNVEDRQVEARLQIDLPPGSSDALVLFEDRMTVARDGLLSDTFAAHQRHVYRLNLKP